jgi:hypothetical protein
MFKSTLRARNEIVRVLLGLPALHNAASVDGLSSETNENERTDPETAFVFEIKRAPISPLKAAVTRLAGPEIRKVDVPFPALSTPVPVAEKFTEVAFV